VTWPLLIPGIFAGAMFAFLVSFTDVTIALFLTPQDGLTFPVWVYGSIQNDLESSLPAVSTIVFVASGLAIAILQRLIGMETVLRGGGAKG
jgi:putative spermidine/putrescine transport system permease protein